LFSRKLVKRFLTKRANGCTNAASRGNDECEMMNDELWQGIFYLIRLPFPLQFIIHHSSLIISELFRRIVDVP
jgi:hypothetical protein